MSRPIPLFETGLVFQNGVVDVPLDALGRPGRDQVVSLRILIRGFGGRLDKLLNIQKPSLPEKPLCFCPEEGIVGGTQLNASFCFCPGNQNPLYFIRVYFVEWPGVVIPESSNELIAEPCQNCLFVIIFS